MSMHENTISRHDLLMDAAKLLSEDGENHEYDRAICELVTLVNTGTTEGTELFEKWLRSIKQFFDFDGRAELRTCIRCGYQVMSADHSPTHHCRPAETYHSAARWPEDRFHIPCIGCGTNLEQVLASEIAVCVDCEPTLTKGV